MRRAWILAAIAAAACAQGARTAGVAPASVDAGTPPGDAIITDYVRAVITTPPESLHLDPFYRKYASAQGFPITASAKASDAAVLVARDIVMHMLAKRPDVRAAMITQGYRVTVMAQAESTMDLPEQRNWKKPALTDQRLTDGERANYARIAAMTDAQYWNSRARGMGGRMTSGAEENILGFPGTKYYGENILVHEFSHGIMSGLRTADPSLYAEIQAAYASAKAKGMYKNHYAINTVAEYWAEGTQWWFESNFDETFDGQPLRGPADLQRYDPTLYAIFERVYPDHRIPLDVYAGKHIAPRRAR